MGPREREKSSGRSAPPTAGNRPFSPSSRNKKLPPQAIVFTVWSGTASAARADAIADTAATPPPREPSLDRGPPLFAQSPSGASSPRQVEGMGWGSHGCGKGKNNWSPSFALAHRVGWMNEFGKVKCALFLYFIN